MSRLTSLEPEDSILAVCVACRAYLLGWVLTVIFRKAEWAGRIPGAGKQWMVVTGSGRLWVWISYPFLVLQHASVSLASYPGLLSCRHDYRELGLWLGEQGKPTEVLGLCVGRAWGDLWG